MCGAWRATERATWCPVGGRPRPDALVRFAEQFIANASVAPGAGGFAREGGAQVLRRWWRWVGSSGGLWS